MGTPGLLAIKPWLSLLPHPPRSLGGRVQRRPQGDSELTPPQPGCVSTAALPCPRPRYLRHTCVFFFSLDQTLFMIKAGKSSGRGPGKSSADGMSSSGKCICRWEVFCFFQLSWLLTVGISFQVEFPALVGLLMQELCFSTCISPELAGRLPWMLLGAALPGLCRLGSNSASIIGEACPGSSEGTSRRT